MIFVDWFEPGYKAGGIIQSCKNFVKAFQNDFQLYIITSDRDLGDLTSYKGIETDQWHPYDQNSQIYYATERQLNFSGIKKIITSVNPHYIYLNSMYSLKFTILPLFLKRFTKINASVIISPRGMLHQGAMQFKSFKKNTFIKFIKILNIHRLVVFHATDEKEKDYINHYFPSAKQVFVADDLGDTSEVKRSFITKPVKSLKLIFLSRIAPNKNLLYLLKLLIDLRTDSHITLDIVGPIEDQIYWEECKTAINSLAQKIPVEYLGPVKNDVIYETYSNYHIFILPTMGESFGHVIFEALLTGLPVIISDQTPWKDLVKLKIGYDIPLSEPILYQDAIKKFADMDNEEYKGWSVAAWNYAKNYQAQTGLKDSYKRIFN